MMAMASSTSAAWIRLSTGPKISVSASSLAAGTPSRTVGPTKLPLPRPAADAPRPSTVAVAPCAAPLAIRPSMRPAARPVR